MNTADINLAVETVGTDLVNQFTTFAYFGLGFLAIIVGAVILRPVFLTASERLDSVFKS